MKKMLVLIGGIIVILLAISAIALFFSVYWGNKVALVPKSTTALYQSSEQGYRFTYPSSWKAEKQKETAKQRGKVTIIQSPETQKKNLNNTLFPGDVFVLSVPYVGDTPPHAQQIKDLIRIGRLATDDKIQPISIGNFTGYTAVTTASTGAVLNVVLQGTKNMLLVKFPNITNMESLNNAQLMILRGLKEF